MAWFSGSATINDAYYYLARRGNYLPVVNKLQVFHRNWGDSYTQMGIKYLGVSVTKSGSDAHLVNGFTMSGSGFRNDASSSYWSTLGSVAAGTVDSFSYSGSGSASFYVTSVAVTDYWYKYSAGGNLNTYGTLQYYDVEHNQNLQMQTDSAGGYWYRFRIPFQYQVTVTIISLRCTTLQMGMTGCVICAN